MDESTSPYTFTMVFDLKMVAPEVVIALVVATVPACQVCAPVVRYHEPSRFTPPVVAAVTETETAPADNIPEFPTLAMFIVPPEIVSELTDRVAPIGFVILTVPSFSYNFV